MGAPPRPPGNGRWRAAPSRRRAGRGRRGGGRGRAGAGGGMGRGAGRLGAALLAAAAAAACGAGAAAQSLGGPPGVPPGSFVEVRGTQFSVPGPDGAPEEVILTGANAYQLVELAARGASEQAATVMDEAVDLGLNSLRLFASPPPMYGPLWKVDSSSGEVSLNENAARGLDFVIAEAGKRGLRVLLSLENYWNVRKNTRARAGITAMVHAASKDPEGPGEDYEREDFYTDPVARRIYRDYVQELLTRNNTVTGVAYRDDPTIFAWELLNEPRCEYCPDSDIADWVNEMAAFVKSLDPNHLVTPGVEGFYSAESSPDMLYVNPSYPSGKDWSHITGQDFGLVHASDDIDFTTIHIWPDNWERTDPEFQEQWIRVHAADSEKLGKPMLVSEFGKDLDEGTLRDRENVLSAAYETIEEDMEAGGAIAGSMFWNLYMDPLRDGYGISLSDSSHDDTFDIIEEHADFAPTTAGLDAGGAGAAALAADTSGSMADFLELDGQNRG